MARSTFSFRSISSRTKQLGQGMSEYLIIVAMIAIAAIGVVGAFGDVVEDQISGMAQELAGGDGGANETAAQTAADTTTAFSGNTNALNNYASENN